MVDDTSGRLLVVMPTYNEAATVRKVVERCEQPSQQRTC